MTAPKCLYRAHGVLVSRMFRHSPTRWLDRAPLAAVRWFLNRFEMWEMRHNFQRMRDDVLRARIVGERLEAVRVALEATTHARKESEKKP